MCVYHLSVFYLVLGIQDQFCQFFVLGTCTWCKNLKTQIFSFSKKIERPIIFYLILRFVYWDDRERILSYSYTLGVVESAVFPEGTSQLLMTSLRFSRGRD